VLVAIAYFLLMALPIPFVHSAILNGFWTPRLILPSLLCFFWAAFLLLDEKVVRKSQKIAYVVLGLVIMQCTVEIVMLVPVDFAGKDLPKPTVAAFEGGQGNGRGQFDSPRGIAVDTAGNIFVADTNNGRIEKFSSNGTFVMQIGPFEAPNGIAIDRAGNIYVAEVGSKHRVQKVGPDGKFIAAWAPGLYGPRKIVIGPDDSIYVVDQGRTRIVKFSPSGEVLATWGSSGTGDGQFSDPTSVAVDPKTNRVFVADPINRRIQVFDSNGKFLTKWLIPEWGRPQGFEDLAIDSQASRLYASSGNMNTILVFDLRGNRLARLSPKSPDKLQGPSAIVLAKNKLLILNKASARVSEIAVPNR
jgi:DNA-binding beta-propeller fold protein YncE